MNDLGISSSWKKWLEEPPEKLQTPFIVFGKSIFEDLPIENLHTDFIVQWACDPEFILKPEGGYEYTGKLINKRLVLSVDNSIRFYPEQYYIELEYWIYLNDILPNFLKQ